MVIEWVFGGGGIGSKAMAMPGEVARGPRLQQWTEGVLRDVVSEGDAEAGTLQWGQGGRCGLEKHRHFWGSST